MESEWNVWVWLVGVVVRRRVSLVAVGRIYGCGCKEVYRFPHTTYPYSSCICSFLQQCPYFLFIIKMFFVLYIYNYIYIYIYTHTRNILKRSNNLKYIIEVLKVN